MVDAENVVNLEGFFKALLPPCIACSLLVFPVVDRVSPKLSVCTETVWRASCNFFRNKVLVKHELVWI